MDYLVMLDNVVVVVICLNVLLLKYLVKELNMLFFFVGLMGMEVYWLVMLFCVAVVCVVVFICCFFVVRLFLLIVEFMRVINLLLLIVGRDLYIFFLSLCCFCCVFRFCARLRRFIARDFVDVCLGLFIVNKISGIMIKFGSVMML